MFVSHDREEIKLEYKSGKNWKKFEQNNETIALNILFVPHNTEKIRVAYEYNHKHKK